MQKVIKGKMYNTETSCYLGSEQYGYPRDFSYYYERLYRTKKGTFFLHGEGGGMSKYRCRCLNGSWASGEDIIVLDEDEAREWVERNLSAEEYECIFGPIEEG